MNLFNIKILMCIQAEEFIINAGAKSMPWYLFYSKNELKLSTPHDDVLMATIYSTLASSHLTVDNLPVASLTSLSSSIAFYVSEKALEALAGGPHGQTLEMVDPGDGRPRKGKGKVKAR